MSRLSIITTCKGRLRNLKQTLSNMVSHEVETVVVDYDCPDKTYEYVTQNHDSVKCVKVENKPYFNRSHAKNIGGKESTSNLLLFVDSDVVLPEETTSQICSIFNQESIVGIYFKRQTWHITGTFAIRRKTFEKIKGYNEQMEGWGAEDYDFMDRTEMVGKVVWIGDYSDLLRRIKTLNHSDDDRTQFHEIKNRHVSRYKNVQISKRCQQANSYIGNLGKWGRCAD